MENQNLIKSKITHIENKGTWNNGEKTFNKFQVSFANGESLNFLALGEFKKKVGEVALYKYKNKEYNTAKLMEYKDSRDYPSTSTANPSTFDDKQKQIARMNCLNNATVLYQNKLLDLEKEENQNKILHLAKIFENYINNG
jgi:hypothetical protein